MKRLLIAGLLLAVACPTPSQAEDLTVSGQVRHRFEVDNRDFNSDTDPGTFGLLRTRLGLEFRPNEQVHGFIQLQDSRLFGEETSTLTDASADAFDLHQGYLVVNDLFEWPVNLKAGRMEVKYGSERLIGAVGWANTGRSFDGVIANIHVDDVSVDLFQFSEVESLQVDDTGDMNVFGTHIDLNVSERYTTQVLGVWQRKEPSSRLDRFTVALYAKGSIGDFGHETELAYQSGDITPPGGMENGISAYMATFNAWYKLSATAWKPTLSGGVELLSGDDDLTDTQYRAFDTMYATNHKFYGFMDFFLNIPVHTFGAGLVDYHGRLKLSPGEKTSALVDVHVFRSHRDLWPDPGNQTGEKSDDFGTEVDLTIKHGYNGNLSFTLGASAFVPGTIFEARRGTSTSTWFYLMTTLNV